MKVMKENRIAVADLSWAEVIPEWLTEAVRTERMVRGMINIVIEKPIEEVGDAELVYFMMPGTLRAPLPSDVTAAYLHAVYNLMKSRHKEIPDFLKEYETIGPDALQEYHDMKRRLYDGRGGEPNHPILTFLREFKKEVHDRKDRRITEFAIKEKQEGNE